MLFSDEFSPKIVFGKSYHIIDVSEIAVDKLVVNAEHTYTFPLDEADGESVCKRTSASMEALGIPLYMGSVAWERLLQPFLRYQRPPFHSSGRM